MRGVSLRKTGGVGGGALTATAADTTADPSPPRGVTASLQRPKLQAQAAGGEELQPLGRTAEDGDKVLFVRAG